MGRRVRKHLSESVGDKQKRNGQKNGEALLEPPPTLLRISCGVDDA